MKINKLKQLEKLLLTFHEFNFNNYSRLQITIIRLIELINNKPSLMDIQTYRDVSFELEQELETLKQLRFEQHKDEAFALSVKNVLNIIKRLYPYLNNVPDINSNEKLTLLQRLIKYLKK